MVRILWITETGGTKVKKKKGQRSIRRRKCAAETVDKKLVSGGD